MKGKANSAESSTNPSNRRLNMGAWLSLQQANFQNCTHMCSHCTKTFPSSQALGGHQNAHRRERNEARRLYIENRIAYRKQFMVLSPTPLNVLQPSDGHKLGNSVAPVVKPGSDNGHVPGFQLGVGYGLRHAHGFKPGLGDGPSGFGPVHRASHGNHYYHPYLKPVHWRSPCETNLLKAMDLTAAFGGGADLEVSSEATKSAANARALYGGEDSNPKNRLDLTLKL